MMTAMPLGKRKAANAAGVADSTTTAQDTVPNYNGGNAPETTYENNPSALDADKATIASTNDAYRLTVDGNLSPAADSGKRDHIDAFHRQRDCQ